MKRHWCAGSRKLKHGGFVVVARRHESACKHKLGQKIAPTGDGRWNSLLDRLSDDSVVNLCCIEKGMRYKVKLEFHLISKLYDFACADTECSVVNKPHPGVMKYPT